MRTTTLRPGLLVSLKTSVRGGVVYKRQDLDAEQAKAEATTQDAAVSRWETTRIIEDPQEHELAAKVRAKCRSTITGVCVQSDFGLLCPPAREEALAAAITEARMLAMAFNQEAKRSEVQVYVITGRVAEDDTEAARAIGSEIRELLEQMEQGIKNAQPEAIREAASRAKNLGAMLSEDVGKRVKAAVEQAREAAKEITKRVEKAGEVAATVVESIKLDAIQTARFAFLDLDTPEAQVERIEHVAPAVDIEVAPADVDPDKVLADIAAVLGQSKPTTPDIEI